MREMHKWKDKIEFSLDNRQIFFLFFGLSVVGCFVFALGVMTGRRLQWEPGEQVAAVGAEDSLAMLDGPDQDERFAFKRGLAESDAEGVPQTRDPEIPPRDEAEVKAEREAQAEIDDKVAQVAAVDAKIAEQQKVLAQAKPEAVQEIKAKPGKKQFTLQMKAFSRREDAAKLAERLEHNGHEVRIESHEVRGRTWHRVRLGVFDDWNVALEAKTTFEEAEHVIAYVVSI